jgi:serine/threonine-protein kinase
VVRKGGSFLEEDDSDRTMRSNPARRSAPARFEHPQEPRRAAEPDYEYDGDFDDEEEDEEDRRRNRRFIAITASAAAVLVLIFVILWFTLFRGLFTSSASYPVPDLLGCTLEEAQAVIDGDDTYKDHFTITVGAYEPSDEYEEGKISKQSPESTRSVKADVTEITVTVSTGPQEEEPEPIELEDYTNADYREVKSKLDNLHLVTVCTPEYSDTVSEGYVVRTDPVAGTQLQEGDTVTIYYSQGPEVKPVTVTSLLGLSENDARTAIAYMHLTLGSVDEEYSNDYAAGKVCYQSIPKDTVVDEQTTINIVISLGPEPEPEEPDEPEPTTPTEPTTPAVSRKEIVVNLPADRTEVCTVTLVINGVQVCNATVEVGETEFSQVYEGDIISIAVLVNNEAYQDYDIVDTGT